MNAKVLCNQLGQSFSSFVEKLIARELKTAAEFKKVFFNPAAAKGTVAISKELAKCAQGHKPAEFTVEESVDHFFWKGIKSHNYGIGRTDDDVTTP